MHDMRATETLPHPDQAAELEELGTEVLDRIHDMFQFGGGEQGVGKNDSFHSDDSHGADSVVMYRESEVLTLRPDFWEPTDGWSRTEATRVDASVRLIYRAAETTPAHTPGRLGRILLRKTCTPAIYEPTDELVYVVGFVNSRSDSAPDILSDRFFDDAAWDKQASVKKQLKQLRRMNHLLDLIREGITE